MPGFPSRPAVLGWRSLMHCRPTRKLACAGLAGLTIWACARAKDETPSGPLGGTGGGTGGTGTKLVGDGTSNESTSSSSSSGGSNTGGLQAGGAPGEAGATSTSNGGTGATSAGASGGSGGVPQDVIDNSDIVLLYRVDAANETSQSIFAHLYLRNQSSEAFPLGAAEVRYWFDPDGLGFSQASHYQGPDIGSVTLTFHDEGDDPYMAVDFMDDATLPPRTGDLNRTEFQLKIDASGGNFDQSNDYSFAPRLTTTTEHDKITVYLAGTLVWGCEPSGTCATDEGAGGAAGAAGAAGADSGS